MTVDASHQIRGLLPIRFGGSGNVKGYVPGAATPWAYYPSNFASGGTTPATWGALVKLNGTYPTVTMTTTATDRVIGVVLGTYDVNTGAVTFGVDVPADAVGAIAQVGVVDVLFHGSGSPGQFVIPSTTLGQASAVDGMRNNAVGMLLESVTSGHTAKVLLVNALGSISAGCNFQLGPSYPGDVAVQGTTGLTADAAHQHLREPDANGIKPLATASASSANGGHVAANAIDGSSGTYWESTGSVSGQHLDIDLGMGRFVTRWVMTQQGNGGNSFASYDLQWSDNGSAWTTYQTRTGNGPGVTDEADDIGLNHRYWRMLFGSATGNVQVQEVTIYTLPYPVIDSTTGVAFPALLGTGTRNGSNFLRDDGTWVAGGFANPMTTQDDIIIGGASGAPTRLAKGSDSTVLTIDATTHHITWETPSSGFTNPMTTKGDLIVGDTGGAAIRKGIGSDTQVLTADAASTGGMKWAAAAGGLTLP
jgi:hypothetical protein